MSAQLRFTSAVVTHLVLAKVGHPQRDEPLKNLAGRNAAFIQTHR